MRKLTLILIFLLAGHVLLAQTFNAENVNANFENALERSAQLKAFSFNKPTLYNMRKVSVSNKVFVRQVGTNNLVNSVTSSIGSDVNLYQQGFNNEIELRLAARQINENVFQLGSNNSFFNFSFGHQNFHRATVLQRGQNQNLIWLGSNSISERMTVVMRGNDRTVLVRNFKR